MGTKVDDEGARLLAENIRTLRVISLARTSISDAAIEHLVKLPKLEILILSDTCISDHGDEMLLGVTNLKSLSLRKTPITNRAVTHLAKLKKLKSIDLEHTAIDDGCLKDLQQLKKIGNHVSYYHTEISPEGKQHLSAQYEAELDRRLKSPKPIFSDEGE